MDSKEEENKRPLEKWTVKIIWTTHRRISGEIPEREEHHLLCRMQQYTSRTQSHILAHLSQCAATEERTNSISSH